jgi:hypothetical protein
MTQPTALRLADALEATDQMHSNADLTSVEVANELRRLHEVNRELLEVIQMLVNDAEPCACADTDLWCPVITAKALIKKATGEKV